MEFRNHFECVGDPHICRGEGIYSSAEIGGKPAVVHDYSGCLTPRVDSCVGSACAKDGDRAIAEALENFFELTLDCSRIGLALPTGVAGTVVMQY
jgi:hypothetical protein